MTIYAIINLSNQKKYIGQTTNLHFRWLRHIREYEKKTNRVLYDAMNKYGIQNFRVEIIEECCFEDRNIREQYWIAHYHTQDRNFGYNMTCGGGGGVTWQNSPRRQEILNIIRFKNTGKIRSKEVRLKMKQSAIQRKPISLTIRSKISDTLKLLHKEGKIVNHLPPIKYGEEHNRYGVHHTEEAKLAISKARKGKTYEEFLPIDKAIQLKQMHKDSLLGDKNPRYKDISPEFMIECLMNTNSVKEAVELLDISYAGFYYKFKKIFNITPNEYKINNTKGLNQ